MKKKDNVIELRGRLDGRQRNRLKRLLNMLYTPRELSEEVGFNLQQVYRVYIPLGCPHERDSRGHIWINGSEFYDWYLDTYSKVILEENEAFCLTCKRAVEMVDVKRQRKNGLVYEECMCQVCGRKIAKIVDRMK
ncbi:MAG: hypothetical protein IIC78_05365 [Chloroflexi bacterium]|nr:hypothetical protein [Chloroflexota bacterium]